MKLSSPNFSHNSNLPQEFSCDGRGGLPELEWSEFPANTKSFAIVVRDPDAPSGDFVHWVCYNISVSVNKISAGSFNIPQTDIIANDSGKTDYCNPCPPTGTHRYIFTIYAIDSEKLAELTRQNFDEIIKSHTLDKTELIGKYKRIK